MSTNALQVVPLTIPAANACVEAWHRHHPPIPPGFGWFALGVVADGVVVAVAIAGRPTNRNNDDGQTVEVLRVASSGYPNACSILLARCRKVASAMGAARIITYTLAEESGSSLRAAGWNMEKRGIKSWWTTQTAGRTPGRERAHSHLEKIRWGVDIRPPIAYSLPVAQQETNGCNQGVLL